MSAIAGVRVAGALALVLGLVLSLVTPNQLKQLPGGMRTPVLALELARSPGEIEAMFGAGRRRDSRIRLHNQRSAPRSQ